MRVFEISRMTNRNGPGIRTLVHFKGCPLRCVWCSTPESQDTAFELRRIPERCIGCGACVSVCPSGAVSPGDGTSEVDRSLCTRCFACTEVCAPKALTVIGADWTPEALAAEILKDRIFFDYSGGGVTFSGGEPLMHVDDGMEELYRLLKEAGVSIGVDTTGFVPWASVERLLPFIDFFLWDLKVMDPVRHRELTGVGNELILENLARVDAYGTKVFIRCVQVPGMTDGDENLTATCGFLRGLSCVQELDLINFHNLGASRYRSVGRVSPVLDLEPLGADELERKRELVERLGIRCRIV